MKILYMYLTPFGLIFTLLSLVTGVEGQTTYAIRSAFCPGAIWADENSVAINAHGGGILLDHGIYYWFGEHKIAGNAGNVAQVGVHVYASRDLNHWDDRGIALAVSIDPGNPIFKGCVLERPKVLFNRKSKKYVMWFHHGKSDGYAFSGIAVADHVTGPYQYIESIHPNAGVWPIDFPEQSRTPLTDQEAKDFAKIRLSGGPVSNFPATQIVRREFTTGGWAADMTLFQDDDGNAYHIYSGENNGSIHISQLSDDYLHEAGKFTRAFIGGFNEAPAVFKHKGRYFLITSNCAGWNPTDARLAMADSIWGPWKALGNPCVGPPEQTKITFESQSTYILPIAGKPDAFIFMADRWRPENAIDGRYIWLPIQFKKDGTPFLKWMNQWDLTFFDNQR